MSETTANRAPTLEELRARRDEIIFADVFGM